MITALRHADDSDTGLPAWPCCLLCAAMALLAQRQQPPLHCWSLHITRSTADFVNTQCPNYIAELLPPLLLLHVQVEVFKLRNGDSILFGGATGQLWAHIVFVPTSGPTVRIRTFWVRDKQHKECTTEPAGPRIRKAAGTAAAAAARGACL